LSATFSAVAAKWPASSRSFTTPGRSRGGGAQHHRGSVLLVITPVCRQAALPNCAWSVRPLPTGVVAQRRQAVGRLHHHRLGVVLQQLRGLGAARARGQGGAVC
jgi:hypothetical protein